MSKFVYEHSHDFWNIAYENLLGVLLEASKRKKKSFFRESLTSVQRESELRESQVKVFYTQLDSSHRQKQKIPSFINVFLCYRDDDKSLSFRKMGSNTDYYFLNVLVRNRELNCDSLINLNSSLFLIFTPFLPENGKSQPTFSRISLSYDPRNDYSYRIDSDGFLILNSKGGSL